MKLSELFATAGISMGEVFEGDTPFETAAADPSCEIILGRRDGKLWFADFSESEGGDAPLRLSSQEEVSRVLAQHTNALAARNSATQGPQGRSAS